jgi:hypothetical protein
VSLDELREDLKRNLAEARKATTVEQLRDHLINTMWPFIEAKLDVIEEIDDAVAELVDQQEDYLQPETAAVFAAVVQSSLQLLQQLVPLVPRDNVELLKQIAAHEQLCAQAVEVLGDVTMIADDGEEEEEDDASAEATEDSHE